MIKYSFEVNWINFEILLVLEGIMEMLYAWDNEILLFSAN